jgi:hypothetical protein
MIGKLIAGAALLGGANHAMGMYEQYSRAQYGDNASHARSIRTARSVMNVAAVAGLGSGLALRGLARKVAPSIGRVASAAGNVPRRALDWASTTTDGFGSLGIWKKAPRPFKESFMTRHPNWSALGIGTTAGLAGTAAGATSAVKQRKQYLPEGRITAINSSPVGGISPALQFSTMGLGLRLHKRSRRM